MAKIYLQMEFDSKEEMLEALGIMQPQRHFRPRGSWTEEKRRRLSEIMKASYAQRMAEQPKKERVKMSDEARENISKGMKAMYARKRANYANKINHVVSTHAEPSALPTPLILSDKEENMAISDVGKHYTNAAKKSVIINRLRAYGLTEELAERVLIQMVRMGKLIQITPNTFRRPTLKIGRPRPHRRGYATIKEFAKEGD